MLTIIFQDIRYPVLKMDGWRRCINTTEEWINNKKLREGRGIEQTHLKQARQRNIWECSCHHYGKAICTHCDYKVLRMNFFKVYYLCYLTATAGTEYYHIWTFLCIVMSEWAKSFWSKLWSKSQLSWSQVVNEWPRSFVLKPVKLQL